MAHINTKSFISSLGTLIQQMGFEIRCKPINRNGASLDLNDFVQSLNLIARQLGLELNQIGTSEKYARLLVGYDLIKEAPTEAANKMLGLLDQSNAQLFQDLFVLLETNFKENGYFVEFGATNGVNFSNSYLLERDFGWHGICAEPARGWHKDLYKNRKSHIETKCVWKFEICLLS